MSKPNLKRIAVIAIGAAGLLAGTACTSMVTEQQLAMLQDLRDQKASLTAEIKRYQDDTRSLQSELQQKQANANDCEGRKKFVEDRLKDWPNVWPDFNPAEVNAPNTRRGN
jgi:uncharacterized protein YlxW (UPF0749 family)